MLTGKNQMPRYLQIAGLLRTRIEAGHFAVGDRLPAIETLAASFGVAPQTLRQALASLEEQGLVRRRQGIGTIVEAEPRAQRWLAMATDWPSLLNLVKELKPRLLLVEETERLPHLGDQTGTLLSSYKYIRRVHYRDDSPFCVIGFFLGSEIFMRDPERFRSSIVVPILDEMPDLAIGRVTQSIRVDVADADTAKLLDIPIAGPIAHVRRVIRTTDDHVIYVADVAYRGDVVALEMDLSSPPPQQDDKPGRKK